jgi:putative SOS response-associated peptidase YedK
MCGRFNVSPSVGGEALAALFGLDFSGLQVRYNAAPSQKVAVIRAGETGVPELAQLTWGLIPGWAKEAKVGFSNINARGETAAQKPAFRSAFKKRRCLVLASGFYEWQRPPEGTGPKQPYNLRLAGGPLFPMAGLWEHWSGGEEVVESCCILTTSANEAVRVVHDRMPVILTPESARRWLDPATPPEALQALIAPYAGAMEVYPVSTLVNAPRNEKPECLAPLVVPRD